MEMGKCSIRPRKFFFMGNEHINKNKEEKKLGVIINGNLSSDKIINKITGETFNLLRNTWVAFTYLDEKMKKLIVLMIHLRLEYTAVLWSTYKKNNIRKIERIQKAESIYKDDPKSDWYTIKTKISKIESWILEEQRT